MIFPGQLPHWVHPNDSGKPRLTVAFNAMVKPRARARPRRDLAHEADVVAIGQPFGLGGDRAEQVGQRLHLALGVIAEHVRRDPVLVAGMADADPHAAEIGAERGVDRAQAVVAGQCRRRSSP